MAKPQIIKIKVDRALVGREVPFDMIYLIPREMREIIHKLWGYALVLPLEESMKQVIFTLKTSGVSEYGQYRDDKKVGLPGVSPDKPRYKVNKQECIDWWTEFAKEHPIDDCLVVVPILTMNRQGRTYPAYMVAQAWFTRQVEGPGARRNKRQPTSRSKQQLPVLDTLDPTAIEKLRPGISESAYLATPRPAPEDKIRPICSICTRNLQFLQGRCIPGMPVCYRSLILEGDAPEEVPTTTDSEPTLSEDILF